MLKDLIQARLELMRAKKASEKETRRLKDDLREVDGKIAKELLARGEDNYIGYTLNSAFEAYFESADDKAVEEIESYFK